MKLCPSIVGNKINTNMKGTLELNVSRNLQIKDNEIKSTDDSQAIQNIFQLGFNRDQRMESIQIVNTNLGEVRSRFITDVELGKGSLI